jgi:hypothetical protein
MMTPEKRALIKSFVENKALFDTVKDVMLASITGSTLERQVIADADLLMDDAMYGALVRAKAKAVGYVEKGFTQLGVIANDKQGVQSNEKNSTR